MEYSRHQDTGRWFTTKPVGVVSALLLTCVAAITVAEYRYEHATEIQQTFLPVYMKSVLASKIGLSDGPYELPALIPSGGAHQSRARYRHHDVAAWLQIAVFDGKRLRDLFEPIAWWIAPVAGISLVLGLQLDSRRRRTQRQGRWIKGIESVTPSEFTRRINRGEW